MGNKLGSSTNDEKMVALAWSMWIEAQVGAPSTFSSYLHHDNPFFYVDLQVYAFIVEVASK